MTEITKDFVEHFEEILRPLVFFIITAAVFILATVHTLKMKRSKIDEMANLALESDNE